MKELYVVGLGPGDPELITVKGMRIISIADVIFVPYSTGTNRSLSYSIIGKYAKKKAKVITLGFPMAKKVNEKELEKLGKEMCEKSEKVSVFVTLGDPTLYSTYFRIDKYVSKCFDKIELVPGVSSVTACASRIKLPLALGEDSILIVPSSRISLIEEVKDKVESIIVMKGNENLDKISELLRKEYTLFYAKRCYLEGEKVIPWDGTFDKDYFSMLIGVKKIER
ncbi:cobalt-factor II C(20)-methyltransferase [Sulfurisphaera javensis]|uniref:Cobalt-factor II C(20)-methyltransferase n=1 Tax=Sulfurisphaera javensis TaxID=2049879 RepID=A0AAT9GN10_9CREN